jgi:hypothetical protein
MTFDRVLLQLPEPIRALTVGMDQASVVTLLQTAFPQEYLAAYKAEVARESVALERSRSGRRKSRQARLAAPADPRGRDWKPTHSGKLNKAVFPKFGITPPYIRALLPYLGNTLRGAVIAIGSRVDRLGQFTMPKRHLANILDVSPWTAQDALGLLEAAGIIRVLYQGDRRQPHVWEYPPVAEFNTGRAIAVLKGAKNEATARVAGA